MLNEWLSPLLTWLGIGLVPFLIIVFIIIYIIKG